MRYWAVKCDRKGRERGDMAASALWMKDSVNERVNERVNVVFVCPASEASHVDSDCFVCVFLSHGENDHVYAYDGKIYIQDVISLFKGNKCKSLVGKPKIFILQVRRKRRRDRKSVV